MPLYSNSQVIDHPGSAIADPTDIPRVQISHEGNKIMEAASDRIDRIERKGNIHVDHLPID